MTQFYLLAAVWTPVTQESIWSWRIGEISANATPDGVAVVGSPPIWGGRRASLNPPPAPIRVDSGVPEEYKGRAGGETTPRRET